MVTFKTLDDFRRYESTYGQLIELQSVSEIVKLSTRQIYNLIKANRFPRPVAQFNRYWQLFSCDEIYNYLEKR